MSGQWRCPFKIQPVQIKPTTKRQAMSYSKRNVSENSKEIRQGKRKTEKDISELAKEKEKRAEKD